MDVPFVDQLQGVDSKKIVKEYGEITDEEAMRRFGASNLKDFSFWAWRACAIASILSIIKTKGNQDLKLQNLVDEALKIDGYAFRNFWGKKDIGWKHSALIEILRKYGFDGQSERNLTLDKLKKYLAEGKYVIASIKSPTGSHMILLKKVGEDEIIFNDPAVFGGHGGENQKIGISKFQEVFRKSGVIVWSNIDK